MARFAVRVCSWTVYRCNAWNKGTCAIRLWGKSGREQMERAIQAPGLLTYADLWMAFSFIGISNPYTSVSDPQTGPCLLYVRSRERSANRAMPVMLTQP